MYLQTSDLTTHIYQEVIDEIIRTDDTIAEDAIDSAIDLAKSYLSKYDTLQLFGDDTTAPTIDSPMLKRYAKDIACWYILTLSNASIQLELFSKLYDDAVRWLKDIQKGLSNPDWPYKDMTAAPVPPDGDSIEYTSNPKRCNHW